MYSITLPFSFAVLFNIGPDDACSDGVSYLAKLDNKQRQEYDYLIKLLQNNRWKQYYCDLPGFTLHCIKTRYNQYLDDHSPYRLFFLVENNSQRLLLLSNLKISSTEHTSQHHLEMVNELLASCARRYTLTPRLALANNVTVPLFIQNTAMANSYSESTVDAPISTSQDQEMLKRVENWNAAVDARNFSRKMIVEIVQYLITRFNQIKDELSEDALYQKLVSLLLSLLMKPSVHIYFSKKGASYTLTTNLGDSSVTQNLSVVPHDSLAWMTSLVDSATKSQRTDNKHDSTAFWAMIFHSYTIAPDFIAHSILKLPVGLMLLSRNLLNDVFMHAFDYFSEGILTYHHIGKLLEIIDHYDALSQLNYDTTTVLLDTLLQFRVAQNSHRSVSSQDDDEVQDSSSVSSSTQSIVSRLTPIPPTLNYALANKLFQQLLPRLDYIHWRQIFTDEYDLMSRDLFRTCCAEIARFELAEKFNLILSWLGAQREMKSSESTEVLTMLYREYQSSVPEIRESTLVVLRNHAHYLRDSCFSTVLAHDESTNNEADSAQSATKKKALAQKARATKAKAKPNISHPAIIKTKLYDFSPFIQQLKRPDLLLSKTLAALQVCLSSHIKNQILSFDDSELETYFVDYFIKSLKHSNKYNLIELVALEGSPQLLKILCQYCQRKDPALLHEHNPAALCHAAIRCDVSLMSLLIYTYHYDPNYCDKQKFSILYTVIDKYADYRKRPSNIKAVLSTLLNAGANVNQVNFEGVPPLYSAIARHYPLDIIRLFLRWGADPNLRVYHTYGNCFSAYDLVLGLKNSSMEMQQLVRNYGGVMVSGPAEIIHVNMDDEGRAGNRTAPRILIGESISEQSTGIYSAQVTMRKKLMACMEGEINIRELLQAISENQFCINVNYFGKSLLHKVIVDLKFDLAKEILLDYKPNLHLQIYEETQSYFAGGYLHFCIYYQFRDFLPMLIEHGCPLEIYNAHGLAPIHTAVWKGDLLSIQHLVLAGANPLMVTKDGKSMETYCREANNLELYRVLKAITRDNVVAVFRDLAPELLLRLAMLQGDIDTIQQLLNKHPNINDVSDDNLKNTALHQVCRGRAKQWRHILDLLLKFYPNKSMNAALRNSDEKTPLNLFYTIGRPPNTDPDYELHNSLLQRLAELTISNSNPNSNRPYFASVDGNGNLVFHNDVTSAAELEKKAKAQLGQDIQYKMVIENNKRSVLSSSDTQRATNSGMTVKKK